MGSMKAVLATFVVMTVAAVSCISCAAGTEPELRAPPDLHDGFSVSSPASVGLDPTPIAGLADALARGDFPKTNAVLVVSGGKLVYETYSGIGGPDVLNDTRSAMKSVTALAIGIAIQDGAVQSQRAPAFSFFKDLRPFANDDAAKEAITIEDLLTMSSALDCNDDDDKSPGNEDNMHPQQNWTRWAVDLPTMSGYSRDASGLGPFRYCTTGAFLMGQIIQRSTRVPVDKYIEQKLLEPLGISKWEWPYSPSGETMTGGGLRLRARDAAKLAWMLVDGGRWQGRQIVPVSWVATALSAHRQANTDHKYGYFFWQYDYATKCGKASGWYMAGNGGNAIVVLKDLNTAVIVERSNYNTHGMHQQTVDLLQKYILPALPC
jgi:CubicO group peptidase (beta-lactamase class C family)